MSAAGDPLTPNEVPVAELRGARSFRYLDDDQLGSLAPRGRLRVAEAGQVVFREGQASDGLHVVLSGRVDLERRGPGGRRVGLGSLGPGCSLGEPSFLDPAPRLATVTATERSRLYVLARDDFLAFVEERPAALSPLLAGVGAELRAAQDRIFADILRDSEVQVEMQAQRYRALAQLVAGVAHEVNTPLGIITTAASVLARDLAELAELAEPEGPVAGAIADALEAARLIGSNLARANQLVQRFKSLSATQAVTVVEEVDLAAVAADVVAFYSPCARTAGLRVEVRDERPDPGVRWVGDSGHLVEVLLNLLSNVQRYAYPEGRGGRVEVVLASAGEPAEGFEVTVRDFGRGMAAEDLGRALEPFFTTGRARGGTGLGLPVAQGVVTEGMHGTLEIRSEPGQGTSVHLRFPRRPPHPEEGPPA